MHMLGINELAPLPHLTVYEALGVGGGMVSLGELLVPDWCHFTDVDSEDHQGQGPFLHIEQKTG